MSAAAGKAGTDARLSAPARHPMALDFASAFGLGYSERSISVVDANGVCMAAIQALHRRVIALHEELVEARRGDRSRDAGGTVTTA